LKEKTRESFIKKSR